jgi:hypothetical protein
MGGPDYEASKNEGLACASPRSPAAAVLESRDVRGDFHRNGDDFGLGLGPTHVNLR